MNGYVYSSVPPLFKVTTKKNEYIYLKDEAALQEYEEKHPGHQVVNRMKGLGEMDPQELHYCLLDNDTRNMLQLVVDDEAVADKIFTDLYGRRVEPRVQFLDMYSSEVTVDME